MEQHLEREMESVILNNDTDLSKGTATDYHHATQTDLEKAQQRTEKIILSEIKNDENSEEDLDDFGLPLPKVSHVATTQEIEQEAEKETLDIISRGNDDGSKPKRNISDSNTNENSFNASEEFHRDSDFQIPPPAYSNANQAEPINTKERTLRSPVWVDMKSVGDYDVYNDDGHIITHEFDFEDEELEGDGKGYTRLNMDEGAESADSVDEDTKYLFKDKVDDDDNAATPISQMQYTKNLLTEGQRIAYAGICRLKMMDMHKSLARQNNKNLKVPLESMDIWIHKIMARIYTHMEISPEEQVMIEMLGDHGVQSEDLVPSLMVTSKVANPIINENKDVLEKTPIEIENETETKSVSTDDSVPVVKSPDSLGSNKTIDLDIRWTVLCDLFLIVVADSVYDSRSRVLLAKMAEALKLRPIDVVKFERRITEALEMQEASQQTWKSEEMIEAHAKSSKKSRYIVMGLATLGGGLVIGLSAGVLAPVIGAGLGAALTTVGIGGTAGFLGGAGGAALITTGGVLTGSSIAAKASARRTRNVRVFEFRPVHNNKRVNLLVTISGWMTGEDDDVRLPFSTIDPVMGDVISLLWEPDVLSSMGQTLNILATEILTQGLQTALGQTVLMSLMSAIQLPLILTKLAYLIDNPWNNSLDRAKAAGLLLADTLISRNLGMRPVSLAGFSLGARVIYYCLVELSRCHAYGIIQDVFLFGAPVVFKQKEFAKASAVVAGRFVNGFKRDDWVLGYLFRATSGGIGRVMGLRPIENGGEVENFECTSFVEGHYGYREAMPRLMQEVGFSVVSEEFTEIEDPDPDGQRERQRELMDDIKAANERNKDGKPKKNRFSNLFSRSSKSHIESDDEYRIENVTNSSDRNSIVLFDIDGIREELASNGVTVNELVSTMPTLNLKEGLKGSETRPRISRIESETIKSSTLEKQNSGTKLDQIGQKSTGIQFHDGWSSAPNLSNGEDAWERSEFRAKESDTHYKYEEFDESDEFENSGHDDIRMSFS